MLATTLLAVLALWNGSLSRPQVQTLVLHVTHHPDNANAARLAEAVRKACVVPSMNCRVAESSKATTFLNLTVDTYCVSVADGRTTVQQLDRRDKDCAAGRQMFAGFGAVTSRVMLPGSVSVQHESLDGLGASLLALVKDRLAEEKGVLVIDREEAR